jgi:hypothetical protein
MSKLNSHKDQFKAICLSTAHLTKEDYDLLGSLACEHGESMHMDRDTGFFIKLYEEDGSDESLNTRKDYSGSLNRIVREAAEAGFRMIEFDCDAEVCEAFPTFEW